LIALRKIILIIFLQGGLNEPLEVSNEGEKKNETD